MPPEEEFNLFPRAENISLVRKQLLPPRLCPALEPAVSQQGPSPSPSPCPHLLEDSGGGRAAGGVLAHAHGRVVVVHLAHLAVLAVVVLAGVWEKTGGKVKGCPIPTFRELASSRGSPAQREAEIETAPSIPPCTGKM